MNVATLADDYTRLINDSIKDKPADMTITRFDPKAKSWVWLSKPGGEPL